MLGPRHTLTESRVSPLVTAAVPFLVNARVTPLGGVLVSFT